MHFGWVGALVCQGNCPHGKTEEWAETLSHESMNYAEAFAQCCLFQAIYDITEERHVFIQILVDHIAAE